MSEYARLESAYQQARESLLSSREPSGHWIGELSTSALSTATAVSALALVSGNTDLLGSAESNSVRQQDKQLIAAGIAWLDQNQNSDGGWGDTDQSYSNISTTMLAEAAFHIAGKASEFEETLSRARRYVTDCGGSIALRKRYGRDKTFAVPILTNYALAGLTPWTNVSALPFELACLPQRFYRFMHLPVVSYAIPALVAIGQARFFSHPPRNRLLRFLRQCAVLPSLRVLERIQPQSGGYLEAVPLTSFVVMSLAATGRRDHLVTQRGARFLRESVRSDGSWPIDTNLATWNSSLSIGALAAGGEDVAKLECLEWLLSCQNRSRHPFTGANPGGWGWSDLSGAVPDADDTPAALLALNFWRQSASCSKANQRHIDEAARSGLRWLVDLQNSDGGWPTFCRGWGALPFDRSGADLTAHALRALQAWLPQIDALRLLNKMRRALRRGVKYLGSCQKPDGSWIPLWFGHQDHPQEENPVYGTAKVLFAFRDLGLDESPTAQRGLEWLRSSQHLDGGWGSGVLGEKGPSSVEETALAVEALLCGKHARNAVALSAGLDWLMRAVETKRYLKPSPIGFYFAKLWYYEKLYPAIYTVSALGHALRSPQSNPETQPSRARQADKSLPDN